jgi:outer membrane biosynthesis protein TonB
MMRTLQSLAIAFCVGLVLLATSTKTDDWDNLTKITFSGPVHIAKTQLPAGTYTFKLLDPQTDRHLVQIFNEGQTHLIATIIAIPDSRLKPTGNTMVKFAETNEGSQASGSVPESGLPLKEWFYPGETSGQEFPVAPQTQQVAAVQPQSAPQPTPEPGPAAKAETPLQTAPAPAAEAPPVAEPAGPAAPETAAQTDQTAPTADQPAVPAKLPQTASRMPLVGLIGILSLTVAASFRILLKVRA